MDTFGKRLISARSKLNLTQKELAEKLGITPTRLNYYEKDKREPDISMIKKISSALNVDPNFLVGVWSEDQYEDFENAKTDADRLYLLNKWGAPSKLSAEYRSLSSEPSSSEINEDELGHSNYQCKIPRDFPGGFFFTTGYLFSTRSFSRWPVSGFWKVLCRSVRFSHPLGMGWHRPFQFCLLHFYMLPAGNPHNPVWTR